MESYGLIEVDIFSKEVNTLNYPEVMEFRELLELVADEHGCLLISFSIDHGTVSFSFDNESLMAEIIKILNDDISYQA